MLGVGVDIVEVGRIRAAVERWGERFLRRVLTQGEVQDCQRRGHFYQSVAARFAAKEAFVKALPFEEARSLGWHEFALQSSPAGRPLPVLGPGAQRLVGDHRVHVSLSHTRDYAAAVVLID